MLNLRGSQTKSQVLQDKKFEKKKLICFFWKKREKSNQFADGLSNQAAFGGKALSSEWTSTKTVERRKRFETEMLRKALLNGQLGRPKCLPFTVCVGSRCVHWALSVLSSIAKHSMHLNFCFSVPSDSFKLKEPISRCISLKFVLNTHRGPRPSGWQKSHRSPFLANSNADCPANGVNGLKRLSTWHKTRSGRVASLPFN